MPNDPIDLPLAERAQHYRAMAEEAMRSAEAAHSHPARAGFIKLAQAWHSLAMQIEVSGERLAEAASEVRPMPLQRAPSVAMPSE